MSFLAIPQVEGGDGATHDLVGLCHGHIQTKQNTYLNIYNYPHKCQGCYILHHQICVIQAKVEI
jgi:hypothetical protein